MEIDLSVDAVNDPVFEADGPDFEDQSNLVYRDSYEYTDINVTFDIGE